jgi:hypothetical protein
MKNKYVPTGVFHYPKPEDEPKGYIHFHNAKSVKPEWGDVAPSFVKVYMNLKLNCLSIVNKQTNRIFCHAHNVKMRNVEFVVKARKNNNANNYRKKVHAYITGEWAGIDMQTLPLVIEKGWRRIHYPYENEFFIDEPSKKPIHKADEIVFYDNDMGSVWHRVLKAEEKAKY